MSGEPSKCQLIVPNYKHTIGRHQETTLKVFLKDTK